MLHLYFHTACPRRAIRSLRIPRLSSAALTVAELPLLALQMMQHAAPVHCLLPCSLALRLPAWRMLHATTANACAKHAAIVHKTQNNAVTQQDEVERAVMWIQWLQCCRHAPPFCSMCCTASLYWMLTYLSRLEGQAAYVAVQHGTTSYTACQLTVIRRTSLPFAAAGLAANRGKLLDAAGNEKPAPLLAPASEPNPTGAPANPLKPPDAASPPAAHGGTTS